MDDRARRVFWGGDGSGEKLLMRGRSGIHENSLEHSALEPWIIQNHLRNTEEF